MDGKPIEVTVGPHRISGTVFGHGAPAVAIEPAFGGTAQSWRAIAEALREETTVVTYDRDPQDRTRSSHHRDPGCPAQRQNPDPAARPNVTPSRLHKLRK
jgi:hypothetical protein